MALSRRSLISGATASGASLYLGSPFTNSIAFGRGQSPHFFFHICVVGGVDATYLFDAKPTQLTDREILCNYLYKHGSRTIPDYKPISYTGRNNNSALRTPLVDNFFSQFGGDFGKANFSVVNGIHMAPPPNNSSHGQNVRFLFGNSTSSGSRAFTVPLGATQDCPLEYVHFGGFGGDVGSSPDFENFKTSLIIGKDGGTSKFATPFSSEWVPNFQNQVDQYMLERFEANGKGRSLFETSSRSAHTSFKRVPNLAQVLAKPTSGSGGSEFQQAVDTALEYLRMGVTAAVTVVYEGDPLLDVHGGSSAANTDLWKDMIQEVYQALSKLDTEFKDGLRMRDVTTFLVSSEFSRTTRQTKTFSSSGTDHNAYTNTILIGGKGIQTGLVVGASDLDDPQFSSMSQLSGAHKSIEGRSGGPLFIMGKAYDFKDRRVHSLQPDTLDRKNFICWPSVVNTLARVFAQSGTSAELRLEDGSTARVIDELIEPVRT